MLAPLVACGLTACGPAAPPPKTTSDAKLLPDLRTAKDRPSVALVVREGDPSGAIAAAIATGSAEDDPEIGAALAGMVEGRLTERGLGASVAPAWDGYRVVVLVSSEAEARTGAETLRTVLAAPAEEKDLAPAKKKLGALAARPLRDPALARWARCIGSPFAKPGKREELTVARLEQWRAANHGTGRVAFGVAADARIAETVASTIIDGPAWPAGAAFANPAAAPKVTTDVYEAPPESAGAPPTVTVHTTLEVATSSAAVATAEALGDRRGPLATRLAALDLPFRVREVDGGAHARGGCVGVVLEATTSKRDVPRDASEDDLANRVADAVALVVVEARVHLTEGGPVLDGRALARRAGDAREASERAAWWTLVDVARRDAQEGTPFGGLGVALGVPMKKAAPKENAPPVEPAATALAAAIERASATYEKPALEGRTRVELGQGEAWVLVGSPCGTEGEAENDTGLSLLATLSTAFAAKTSPLAQHVKVEPWIVPDGAGLVVHGPALPGESPAAHARRLADVASRSFAAEPLGASAIALARAEAFRQETRREGDALATLATVLAPTRPSSVVAWGHADAIARASDAAIVARAQALRTGPLRVAVVANVDAAQAEAAVRAADRWIDRAAREAKACRGNNPDRVPSQPGTYALASRPPASPEAILAFPISDDGGAAQLVVEALGGGLLERALASSGATSFAAKIVGAPRAPAIVLRISSAQDKLDDAVMQTRALIARIHEAGLVQADYDRAVAQAAKSELATALDPGARVVALFRGEDIAGPNKRPRPRPSAADVRAFAQKQLGEDAMIVIASRPPRSTPPPATPARKP